MMKEKSMQTIYNQSGTALKESRTWLGYSMEKMAREIGCTFQSYWLWESGKICPAVSIWNKVSDIVKKEAKKRFKDDFLKSIGMHGISRFVKNTDGTTRQKTEKEIITEIESEVEYAAYLKKKVFAKKFPELKDLPFPELFHKFCQSQIGETATILLNLIPEPKAVTRFRSSRRKKIPNNIACSFRSKNTITVRLKEPKRQKRKSDKASSDGGGGDDPPEPSPLPSEGLAGQGQINKNIKTKYKVVFIETDMKISPDTIRNSTEFLVAQFLKVYYQDIKNEKRNNPK